MKEKEVDIALYNDIETLIDLQRFTLKNLKNSRPPQSVLQFQEDILTCLEALADMREPVTEIRDSNLTKN